jgi:hypothetical protein
MGQTKPKTRFLEERMRMNLLVLRRQPMVKRNRFVVTLLPLACLAIGWGGPKTPAITDPDAGVKSPAKAPTTAELLAAARKLDHLIDGLVSVNKLPPRVEFRMDPDPMPDGSVWGMFASNRCPIFPKDYDWNDHKRVRGALQELWNADRAELWPRLVERSADKRYSTTYIIDENCVRFTVGHICWWIARSDLLYAYQQFSWQACGAMGVTIMPWDFSEACYPVLSCPFGLQDARSAYPDAVNGGEDLRKWYKERAGQPLYQLQIEVCEHVMKEVERRENVHKDLRTSFIRRVSEQVETLRKTHRAVLMKYGPIDPEIMKSFNKKMGTEIREDYEQFQRAKANQAKK